MTKFVVLLGRPPGMDRAAFLAGLLERSRGTAGNTEGLIVNLVDVPPEEAGLRPGGSPAFDAVIELWVPGERKAVALVARIAPDAGEPSNLYPAVETLEKPRKRDWADGVASPGIKSLYLMRRHPGLSHEEAVQHWRDVHVPKALKHHVGMWRYARNVFGPPVDPAEDWDGMAELHFRTSDDLIHRFYDSDEGRRVIAEDVATFSGGGRALHTHEWILKTPPGA